MSLKTWTLCAIATLALLAFPIISRAQYAAQVISYDPGSTAAAGFTSASAALGEPSRFTPDANFPSVVSPFSPPFDPGQFVSIGENGQITLRLSNYVIPQAGPTPEIGIFENMGLIEDFPNVRATNPATQFGLDSAVVDVSANGMTWVPVGTVTADVPTNGYTDLTDPFSATPGSALSDFQKPFIGGLSSFDGLSFLGMLSLLDGSGGGKWIDISGTGLAEVGYIRFSVPPGLNSPNNFELDAVSISHAALGGATLPEPSAIVITFVAGGCLWLMDRPLGRCSIGVAHRGEQKADKMRWANAHA